MTHFESQSIVNAPVEKVYAFLEDCNNHETLQPENIDRWTSTKDEASFTIKNMGNLTLKIDERIPNKKINFVAKAGAPFDVSITWELEAQAGSTATTLVLAANLPMMLKMIASGPLQKLVNHQMEKLKETFSQ